MKLLILGGTKFLGVYLAEAALQRGHTVTLFNRGKTNPELFPNVEHLPGDRANDLQALQGRHWDAVIDTCGFVPRVVQVVAELLADVVAHYTFISTLNVYADTSQTGIDEQAALATLDTDTEEVTAQSYGPLKAQCERVVSELWSERALIIRPGLIVGPRDATCRFSYWPHRSACGGEILAPDHKEQPVQIIDVRDLANWTIHMVEQKQTGNYNAAGPDYALTLQHVLEECIRVVGEPATLTWVDEAFLAQNGVQPWSELPLWLPRSTEDAGFLSINNHKAIQAGLTFRPLAETIRDTLAWDSAHPAEMAGSAGLKAEREAELLQAWQQRS